MPIAVITDVVIRRGIAERLLGDYEIRLPTINDDVYRLYRLASGRNHIPSLDFDNATKVQKLIFELKDRIVPKPESSPEGFIIP